MNRFGALVEALSSRTEPDDQIRLLAHELQHLAPGERAAIVAFLASPPKGRRIRMKTLETRIREHHGDTLLNLSQEFVGDMTETVALLWPQEPGLNRPPPPSEIQQALSGLGPSRFPVQIQKWLGACDASGRHTLIRLMTGRFKCPVSTDALTQAFATIGLTHVIPPLRQVEGSAHRDLFAEPRQPRPGSIRAVLLYVHRGTSRSEPLTCTFGVAHGDGFMPVGKAEAAGLSPDIEAFARDNTLRRFGPTTEVVHTPANVLVLEVSFKDITISRRHKAGLILAAPSITTIVDNGRDDSISSLEDLMNRLPASTPHG